MGLSANQSRGKRTWKFIVKVSRLFRYPVKSLPGLEVESLSFDDFGPRGDRRWMIVDQSGRFLTQRKYPQLALVGVALDGDTVIVDVPGEGRHRLEVTERSRQVAVWRDQMPANEEAGAASGALSRWLGLPVSLVFMPETTFRQVDVRFVPERRRVSFADGFPLLVVNQASADQVSSWVGRQMDVRRFRPGIVFEGAKAFAEDGWRAVRIGSMVVDLVKPCSRCIMTTVDPETGRKDDGGEPLRSLAHFRGSADGPLFGINGVHQGTGSVRVGDELIPVSSENSGKANP